MLLFEMSFHMHVSKTGDLEHCVIHGEDLFVCRAGFIKNNPIFLGGITQVVKF